METVNCNPFTFYAWTLQVVHQFLMGKLFSKPDRKRARSNSDPVRKFGKPVVKDDSMKRHTFDPRLLENKDSNNSWKGLIGVKNEHSGPVNTLTAINPKYCISGGKDALIILQVFYLMFIC